MASRAPGAPSDALFPGPRGDQFSRDAIRRLVERHAATAALTVPSLAIKDVTPHTLRHSCAMNLLRDGVDTATIATLLGHEDVRTTYGVYLHADLPLISEVPPNEVREQLVPLMPVTTHNSVVVLRQLATWPVNQQLTAIAEKVNMTLPTVHRLLRSLVVAGLAWSSRTHDRRATAFGSELARLAAHYLAGLPVATAAPRTSSSSVTRPRAP